MRQEDISISSSDCPIFSELWASIASEQERVFRELGSAVGSKFERVGMARWCGYAGSIDGLLNLWSSRLCILFFS